MTRAATNGRSRRAVPADLTVVDNGLVFDDGRDELHHLWFHLVEREGGREYPLYRIVRLKMLRYLPQEVRQDAGLLDTMRTALTGLYNQRIADYDPCMLVAGIFDPPLGVVQCYGAVGVGEEREQAVRSADLGMAAVEGVMANFCQSRLEPLDVLKADWLRRAFVEMGHSLVVIGQPDPRLSARGMGREGPAEKQTTMTGETAYTLQQNEMLFRALARLQEEFLFLVLASRLAQKDLATMLEGVASEASVPASRQTGTKSISFGISLPLSASGGLAESAGSSFGRSEGESVSDSLGESEVDTHTEGRATTVGHAVTDGWAHTEGHATTSGGSTSHSVTVTEGVSDSSGESRGSAYTRGHATTSGSFGSSGVSVSQTISRAPGTSTITQPGAVKSSTVVTPPLVKRTTTTDFGGTDFRDEMLESGNLDDAIRDVAGAAKAAGEGDLAGVVDGLGDALDALDPRAARRAVDEYLTGSDQYAVVTLGGASVNGGGSINSDLGSDENGLRGQGNASVQTPFSPGATIPTGKYTTVSEDIEVMEPGQTSTTTIARPTKSLSTPLGPTVTSSVVHTSSGGSSRSATNSEAVSESRGASTSHGTSRSVARTTARSSFSSSTHSVSDTTSHSETRSTASTESVSDGHSRGVSRTHGTGRTSGTSVGRALSVGRTLGMGAGVVPSIAASKSYQWWDDKAVQLTQILRAQEELLRQATLEGAFLTDAYVLCRTERGAAAAEAALRQAFHGSQLPVVTPVQTRRLSPEEQAYIRLHAMTFTPSTREETVAGALETYRDSTLLLPLQLAAYVAPGLFEEGAAVTTQERIPAFAFVPDSPGDVVLGHLWSTETGRLTPAQLRLSDARMFHTAFAGDTGFGKTVAAERLAVETTRLWKTRTIVLDFGAGWRRMLEAPLGEPGRAEVWQVFPGATVPIRWNPLQVGRRIDPERQMRATCELVRNAGRMGPRQLGFMRRALKKLYVEHGVLVSFQEVEEDERWNHVRDDEWELIRAARAERGLAPRARGRNVALADLGPFERQELAVHRSKQVDLVAWHGELERAFDRLPRNAVTDRTSLEGVLLRVEPFVEGEMRRMYGQGEGSIAIENLGLLGPAGDPWGISVLEGGAEMDEFAKAVVFGLVAWHLYNDAVVRRRQSIGRGNERRLQIFFEEANKVLSGVAVDTGDRDGGGQGHASEIWQTMWRDGRKYGIWLHVIAQTVSELPAGILSSCNNAFFSQTKDPRDRDLMMAHLAFSEKGFTDEDYKRFLSRMAVKMAVCRLGYADDTMHTTPFLCRPVMVPAAEPTDVELLAHHLAMREALEGRAPAKSGY